MFIGPFIVAVSAFGVASVIVDGGAPTSDYILVLTTFALCYLSWIFCIIFAEARLSDSIEADVESLRVRRLLLWSDYARPAAGFESGERPRPGGAADANDIGKLVLLQSVAMDRQIMQDKSARLAQPERP